MKVDAKIRGPRRLNRSSSLLAHVLGDVFQLVEMGVSSLKLVRIIIIENSPVVRSQHVVIAIVPLVLEKRPPPVVIHIIPIVFIVVYI